MENKINYYDQGLKKYVSHNAYAFIDACGHCIMITCGEKNRDSIAEYLK